MHWLLNTLLLIVGLWIGLACGLDSDDRMLRRNAKCMTDTTTTLHRLTVSSASGTVPLSAEAVEKRVRGQLERGEFTWGRSGPTTPATVNRSWREPREERGRKAHGRGQSGIRMVPARLNARCAMVATESAASGVDWMTGATTWVRMMWRICNREGPKRADEIRREPGRPNPRTDRFT